MPKIDDDAKAWQKDMAERIGGAVAARRRELKLTAAALAERTRELGYPISRVAIGKIETNHREGKFDLAELLVLAAALEVSSLPLIYPDEPDHKIEALPGQPMSTLDATIRFVGSNERIWPSAAVAELAGQLNRVSAAITGIVHPTAVPKSKEGKK